MCCHRAVTEEFDALRIAYDDLAAVAGTLDETTSWLPSACLGWTVRDLVFHLLTDAQRALVALATPAQGPADRDAVTYWVDAPGGDDPESRNVRAIRTMASAWRLDYLTQTYAETTRAVVTLADRMPADQHLPTQGHVLTARDLFATLVVEAAIHHLDLVANLHGPGPRSEPLAHVRRTLDGLLGRAVPVDWDGATWARAGTGRRALTNEERTALGTDAARLPLLRSPTSTGAAGVGRAPLTPTAAEVQQRLGLGLRCGSMIAGGVKTGWPSGSRWMSHPGRWTST